MQTSSGKFSEWLASMRPAIPDAWQRLADTIVRAGEEVHGALGPGQPREVYEAALAHELGLRGLSVERGRPVRLRYKGVELPEQKLDLVVNALIAVQVRSSSDLSDIPAEHLEGMIRAADLPMGLVMNFDGMLVRHGVYRLFNRVASAALALLPTPETVPDASIRE